MPLMLVGVNGLGIWLVSTGAPKWWLVATLAGALALSFTAERAMPYAREWNRNRGDLRRDVAHALVNEGSILATLATLPLLASVTSVADLWPHHWPFAIQVVAAIVIADAGITLGHWWSHHYGPLWRLHSVHHSVRRFYGLNGLVKHPLHQGVELALGVTPLLLAGISVDVATALAFCTAIQLFVQHSNVDTRTGPLRRVLATNEVHRFHHLRWAGAGDVNFGLFTCLWDHLLRTWTYDPDRHFSSSDLGIAAEPDYPDAYLAQLTHPFSERTPSTPADTDEEHQVDRQTQTTTGAATDGVATR